MSQENVNTVRGMYEAFERGDIPVVLAALDPQVEWWEAETFIYADGNYKRTIHETTSMKLLFRVVSRIVLAARVKVYQLT